MSHTYTRIPQQIEIFPGGLGGRTEIGLILNQDGERETRGDSPPSLPPVAASGFDVCTPGKKKKKGERKKVQRLAAANNTAQICCNSVKQEGCCNALNSGQQMHPDLKRRLGKNLGKQGSVPICNLAALRIMLQTFRCLAPWKVNLREI